MPNPKVHAGPQRDWILPIGAQPEPDGVRFRVWAPRADDLQVELEGGRRASLTPEGDGYYSGTIGGLGAGTRYRYVIGGEGFPDPASRWQPDGVHGPSAVVEPDAFEWSDDQWRGLSLGELILYELHVGTCTADGTFAALIPYLSHLKRLGITAIELMPVAQFPGRRNWGYDGVGLYAPQNSYGGPDRLKHLVDAAHRMGLGVFLDVVYNHVGPEGNYLDQYGPYFTEAYRTPWGRAVNYDGADSDAVRAFVVENARYWVHEYHLDGLRLDAIHGIFDFSARHILAELTEAVHADAARLGRSVLVIAESDLNDPRVIRPRDLGGYGLDAQWADDFHHALHARLTGERNGYYEDFGRLEHLAAALRGGFVYEGQHSTHRRRRHGAPLRDRPLAQLVIATQNHDQVGNRAQGERLGALVPAPALRVAAAAVLLAPATPLLFMGEEHGETAPFRYFVDHEDPALIEAVREGRRQEFAAFGAFLSSAVPDPADEATFRRSMLSWNGPSTPLTDLNSDQRALFQWYQQLIQLRKTIPALGPAMRADTPMDVWSFGEHVLVVHRWADEGPAALVLMNLSGARTIVTLDAPCAQWSRRLTSTATDYGGDGRSDAPPTLLLNGAPVTVALAAYQVAIYLSI